jgi:hypothetical protein
MPTANLKSHSHNDHEQPPSLFWSKIYKKKNTNASALDSTFLTAMATAHPALLGAGLLPVIT